MNADPDTIILPVLVLGTAVLVEAVAIYWLAVLLILERNRRVNEEQGGDQSPPSGDDHGDDFLHDENWWKKR